MEVRPMVEDDRESAFPIFIEAFSGDPSDLRAALELPLPDRWVVTDGGQVRGLLRVLRTRHFFGGRSVSSCDLAAVAIAAPYRGCGLGTALVTEVLRAHRDEGLAMSTLYPATMAPYRRAGFELGGTRTRWSAPLAEVPLRDTKLDVVAFGDDSQDRVAACYREFAAEHAGLMDRPDWWWGPRVTGVPDDTTLYRYLVTDGNDVRGYVIHTHLHEPGSFPGQWAHGDEQPWALATRDFVWRDHEAAAALLRYAAGHASMLGTRLIWTGPPVEPLATLFRGSQPAVELRFGWMARLLDVRAALEARGYPAGLDAVVELQIEGDVLGGVAAYRVEIAGGTASVSEIDSAAATVDIGALSAIFTGQLAATDAVALGRLRGAGSELRAALELAFHSQGPPWTFDFF